MEQKKELKKFDSLVMNITALVGPARALTVYDKTSKDEALKACSQIMGLDKEVEAVRKALTGPLVELKSAIDARAKEVRGPLTDASGILKGRLLEYDETVRQEAELEERRVQAERRRLEKEAQAKLEAARAIASDKHEAAAEQAQILREAQVSDDELRAERDDIREEKVKGVRTVWKFQITNETLVPAPFRVVDEKLIRQAVAAGKRSIPGVRIWEESAIAVRSSSPAFRTGASDGR